jgi:excisionase family DNA binding protein
MNLELTMREMIATIVREEIDRALSAKEPAAAPAPQYMTTRQLAAQTGLAVVTLEAWRRQGEGPPHVRVGRRVLYERTAVEAWLAAHERRPRARR